MKEKLIDLIISSLKKLEINDINIEITKPKNNENGDYSCNIALKLTKVMSQSPLDIAKKIVKNMDWQTDTNILNVEIKEPGFINFFLKKDYLLNNLKLCLEQGKNYGSSLIGKGKKYNIEFVSANPTGILHLGNARGGAYGDSLARILKFSGFNVTKEYYINDAGNQITNLALSIIYQYKKLCNVEGSMPENGYYGAEIKKIAQKLYDENKDKLLNNSLDYFKELGTKELLDIIINDLKEYRITYDIFTSEKAIRDKYSPAEVLDNLAQKGYTYEKDGAIWFKCSSLLDDKDHVLKKEDGEYTYLVPDIAYHLDKYGRGYDKIIDILGTDHHGYVARLKSSMKAFNQDTEKLDVKLLQLVRLVENGEVVKMSKRTGKSVTLKELMEEVGVNAARYFFSRYSLDTQMDFDLTEAKAKNNENPVYYVSYAYARICSILKEKENTEKIEKYWTLDNEDAYNVLEKVYEFPEVVKNAALKELPHLITKYVYDLATIFHAFYSKNRILVADEQETKENLDLIKAVKITLENALDLIGVIPPEKM